ncbi:hypothetical protein GCM10010977_10900 [Citricoccus zhacaiensis]|uniref:Di-and tripeptidase n=1 Tax=Citricoccus zhacaiensis TaxID=489142 RepID=A0ABQ2LU09_9MICC|nr:hypothetical protein [Citricoccus zhacaiensis]GGO43216.1 hypothetical protein GCM10010977_10900 [Citricoccus zhacaiensis]
MAKKSIISTVAGQKATDFALNRAVDPHGNPTPAFQKIVLRAVEVQRPLVLRNLNRLRRSHPDETPAHLAERLGKQYLTAVTGGGAAVGGTAVVPGVGTAAALGLSAAATIGFLETTALYAQSVAELMGVTTEDPQRAQTLVMAVMLGDDGRKLLRDFTSQANGSGSGPLAGAVAAISGTSGISDVLFQQMKRMFMKKFIVRQGAGMLGRLVPFGVGAVIGGVGNRAMGKSVIKAAQNIFGPLPASLPGRLVTDLQALPAGKKAKHSAAGARGAGDVTAGADADSEDAGTDPELVALLEEGVRADIEALRADGTLDALRAEDPAGFAADVEAARAEHRRNRTRGQ